MTNIRKSIEIAQKLILKGIDKEKYMLYPYATENLVGLFDSIDVAGKDCLTITGSFDQGLDMVLKGAKSVTAFDINPLSLPYADLKKSLILTKYRKEIYFEYLQGYYDYLEPYAFHPKVFKQISKNLEKDSYIFWQEIFSSFDKQQISKGMFFDGLPYYEQKHFVSYMQDNHYYTLQERLSNVDIELRESDIATLPNELHQSYDIIYFSNIIGYPNVIYDGKGKEEKLCTYRDLINTYSNFLNKDGKIISYIYDPFNNQGCDEIPIFDKSLRETIFSGPEYSYIYFPAYFSDTKDGCLVYTKK